MRCSLVAWATLAVVFGTPASAARACGHGPACKAAVALPLAALAGHCRQELMPRGRRGPVGPGPLPRARRRAPGGPAAAGGAAGAAAGPLAGLGAAAFPVGPEEPTGIMYHDHASG